MSEDPAKTQPTSTAGEPQAEHAPPSPDWLSRNADWLKGIGVTMAFIMFFGTLTLALYPTTEEGLRFSLFATVQAVLLTTLSLFFLWYGMLVAITYCFAIYPRRRRFSSGFNPAILVQQTPQQTIVRRYPVDDALHAVLCTLIPCWFALALSFMVYFFANSDSIDFTIHFSYRTIAILLTACSVLTLGAGLVGFLTWQKWRSDEYGVRIDLEKRLLYPARSLFGLAEPQPIELRLVRAIHAEHWACVKKIDGQTVASAMPKMSITVELNDSGRDRHVHLLATRHADRVVPWLATSLGVPYQTRSSDERTIKYGLHRSFRVSKPLPDDIDN